MARIIFILSGFTLFGCSCCERGCGDGLYTCGVIDKTAPYIRPIKYDYQHQLILYESGVVEIEIWGPPWVLIYSLDEICGSDSIVDIAIYDDKIVHSNFSDHPYELEPPENEYFILALYSNRCFKLDKDFNLLFEFGWAGDDTTILIDAKAVTINYIGEIFIVDSGDGSLKIYNKEGAFQRKSSYLGLPARIEDYNMFLYVLDKSTSTIKKYDYDGTYIATIIDTPFFEDIVAFVFEDEDSMWLVDFDGGRVSLVSIFGTISEVKYDCCKDDILINFGKIVEIDRMFSLFFLVDYEKNSIISFREIICAL
ncbi:MAG: hypothetical protein JSW64_03840 [Candidatus Zixiibacteriota bacterium]|nr:MAG: hypothetical protein JSW64_03840 [candidate division Zixibacteria bacterium]